MLCAERAERVHIQLYVVFTPYLKKAALTFSLLVVPPEEPFNGQKGCCPRASPDTIGFWWRPTPRPRPSSASASSPGWRRRGRRRWRRGGLWLLLLPPGPCCAPSLLAAAAAAAAACRMLPTASIGSSWALAMDPILSPTLPCSGWSLALSTLRRLALLLLLLLSLI